MEKVVVVLGKGEYANVGDLIQRKEGKFSAVWRKRCEENNVDPSGVFVINAKWGGFNISPKDNPEKKLISPHRNDEYTFDPFAFHRVKVFEIVEELD